MSREVFTSQDSTEVGYYKSILDEAGIVTFVRNQYADNVVVAGATFLPALCVTEDSDYDEAIRILKECRPVEPAGAVDWTCPSCAEKNPANFEVCWKCQAARPVNA